MPPRWAQGWAVCAAALASLSLSHAASSASELTLTATDASVQVKIDTDVTSATFGSLLSVQAPGSEGLLQGQHSSVPIWTSSWITTETSSSPITVSALDGDDDGRVCSYTQEGDDQAMLRWDGVKIRLSDQDEDTETELTSVLCSTSASRAPARRSDYGRGR
mmetsp:Transcript_72584/g.206704  ORF Transcript_72584/g.206704 Transcript_72584/m.206704 type:complete len:162 (-) Transcript_72584:2516-3001(-)